MMTENDIRPQHLLKEQERLCNIDIQRIMSRKKEFIIVSCPACDGNSYKKKFTKHGMDFVKCNNCRTVYANPRPTVEIVQDHYNHSENYKYWATHIFPLTEKIRREKIFVPRVNRVIEYCNRYNINKNTLVEVGPGFGTFCKELKSRNVFKKIIPVEPTPELANELRKKKFNVIEKFIEQVDEKEIADVVVAFEVIEHMLNPKKFLEIIFQLLRKNGMLYLTCPNCEGFDTLVLHEKAPAVDVEHLTLFNPDSLCLLLKKKGFKILDVQTPGILDTDIVKNRLEEDAELKQNNPFFNLLFLQRPGKYGNEFQEFLIKNKLSGNLAIIAQK